MTASNKLRIFAIAAAVLLLVNCTGAGQKTVTDNSWSKFYGTYTGNAASVITGELSERELTVTIKPWEDKGFTVEWTTLIYRADGRKKLTDLSINFYPSARPGIFAAAMRTDVFGQAVPFNPVGEQADPYVWAGLETDTLTVSALYIVDGGGYEMHVYQRSLTEDGLSLEFERLSNGDQVTNVSALLQPVR